VVERKLNRALACAALVLAAGCATPQPQPALLDQQQYAKAVRDSYSGFTWPVGRTPDLGVLADRSGPGEQGRVPAGSERTVLEITNSCAWYAHWEDARRRGDQAAAAAALKVMDEVLPKFSPEDPGGQEYARETAAKARAGDGAQAADYVTTNCDSVRWK
jgi:hypothetical protein